MFTKAEQKTSLFHKTHANKSAKPVLVRAKADLLLGKFIEQNIKDTKTLKM